MNLTATHPSRGDTPRLDDGAIGGYFRRRRAGARRVSQPVRATAVGLRRRYVGPNDAEDIVQTVMIEAWGADGTDTTPTAPFRRGCSPSSSAGRSTSYEPRSP